MKKTATERMQESPLLQRYQKIVKTWLFVVLALNFLIGLVLSTQISAFFFVIFIVAILPGVIIFLGIRRMKVWAYGLYFFILLVSIGGNLSFEGSWYAIAIDVFMTVANIYVMVLTWKLYAGLYPSKQRQELERLQQQTPPTQT